MSTGSQDGANAAKLEKESKEAQEIAPVNYIQMSRAETFVGLGDFPEKVDLTGWPGCLQDMRRVRWLVGLLVEWRWFERFTFLVILANCLYLAFENLDRTTVSILGICFLSYFTLEAIMKIYAFGLFRGRKAYFQSGWNWLDLLVIAADWAVNFGTFGHDSGSRVSVLRVLRIFRAIRSLRGAKLLGGRTPLVQVAVTAAMDAIPALMPIVAIAMFMALLFGQPMLLIARGLYSNRCVLSSETQEYLANLTATGTPGDRSSYLYTTALEANRLCSSYRPCPAGFQCVQGVAPNFGFTNFDNMLTTVLIIFRIVCLDGWGQLMYYALDVMPVTVIIWFVLVVIIGAYFVKRMFTSSFMGSFSDACAAMYKADEEKRAGYRLKHATIIKKWGSSDELFVAKGHSTVKTASARAIVYWLKKHRYASTMQEALQIGSELHEARILKGNFIGGFRNYPTNVYELWLGGHSEMAPSAVEELEGELKMAVHELFDIRKGGVSSLRRTFGALKNPSLHKFMMSAPVTVFFFLATFTSVVTLCVQHWGQSPETDQILETMNFVFLGIFGAEIILMAIADPSTFAHDKYNYLDLFIVATGLVDIILVSVFTAGGGTFSSFGSAGLRVLRLLRISRVFKLIRYSPSLRQGVRVIGTIIPALLAILFVEGIVLVMYAIMGRALFSHHQPNVSPLRWGSIWEALLSVYIMWGGRYLSDVMFDTMNTSGGWAVIFYVAFTIMLVFCLNSLLLVVILQNFQLEQNRRRQSYLADLEQAALAAEAAVAVQKAKNKDGQQDGENNSDASPPASPTAADGNKATADGKQATNGANGDNKLVPLELEQAGSKQAQHRTCWQSFQACRLRLRHGLKHHYFEVFFWFVALGNVIFMGWENVVYRSNLSRGIEMIWVIIFGLEAVVKLFAMDIVYFRSGWRILDLVLVVVYAIGLFPGKFAHDVRWIRFLRPLRLARPLPLWRMGLRAFWGAIKLAANVMGLGVLWFVASTLAAVNLFGGTLKYCTDPQVVYRGECVGSFINQYGVEQARQWVNQPWYFDDFFHATSALLQSIISGTWVKIMFATMSSVAVDFQPVSPFNVFEQGSPATCIYFVIVIFVMDMFLKFFVAIVCVNFREIREVDAGIAHLSPGERKWVQIQKRLLFFRPPMHYQPPNFDKNSFRARMFRLVTSGPYKKAEIYVTLIPVIISCINYNHQPIGLAGILLFVRGSLVVIFTTALTLKLIGVGWSQYSRYWKNRITFVMILLGIGDVVWSFLEPTGDHLSDLSFWCLLAALRLVDEVPALRAVWHRLALSSMLLLQIVGVCAVVIGSFAVLFKDIYGELGSQVPNFNEYIRFDSFPYAYMIIFRIATSDGWVTLMNNVAGACQPPLQDCGHFKWSALTLFPIVWLIFNLFLLNLVVAIILENFYELPGYGTVDTPISDKDMVSFAHHWAEYDGDGDLELSVANLPRLMRCLAPPFGCAASRGESILGGAITINRAVIAKTGDSNASATQGNASANSGEGEKAKEATEGDKQKEGVEGENKENKVEVKENNPNNEDNKEVKNKEAKQREEANSELLRDILYSLDLPVSTRGTVSYTATLRALVFRVSGFEVPPNVKPQRIILEKLSHGAIPRHTPPKQAGDSKHKVLKSLQDFATSIGTGPQGSEEVCAVLEGADKEEDKGEPAVAISGTTTTTTTTTSTSTSSSSVAGKKVNISNTTTTTTTTTTDPFASSVQTDIQAEREKHAALGKVLRDLSCPRFLSLRYYTPAEWMAATVIQLYWRNSRSTEVDPKTGKKAKNKQAKKQVVRVLVAREEGQIFRNFKQRRQQAVAQLHASVGATKVDIATKPE